MRITLIASSSALHEQARLDKRSRLLQARTEELKKERASRRGDSAEAGKEPGNPAIAASDRAQDPIESFRSSLQRAGLFIQHCLH